MTTAKRSPSLVEDTTVSVQAAGWGDVPVIISERPDLSAYHHWVYLLNLLADLDRDAVMIVQDDIQCCKNLRAYIEQVLDPQVPMMFAPFVTPIGYKNEGRGRTGWWPTRSGMNHYGAWMFILTKALVPTMLKALPKDTPRGKHIDNYVSQVCYDRKIEFRLHYPSLIQHMGDACSTLGYGPLESARTCAGYTGSAVELTAKPD